MNDIVIVKVENSPRNAWKLGRIVKAEQSEDGQVRKVDLIMSDRSLDKNGSKPVVHLSRPVHSLVLLLEADDKETGFPIEEP